MESKKCWQPSLRKIGKQDSPMDLHSKTFLIFSSLWPNSAPCKCHALCFLAQVLERKNLIGRLVPDVPPGSNPLWPEGGVMENKYGCQVLSSGQNGRLRRGPVFWHCRKLPHLLCGIFPLLSMPRDLPALTLTISSPSFLHLPSCRPYSSPLYPYSPGQIIYPF